MGAFILPVFLPMLIYFLVNNKDIQKQAIYATVLQVIPAVSFLSFFFVRFLDIFHMSFSNVFLFLFPCIIILNVIVLIWNILRGLRIFAQE